MSCAKQRSAAFVGVPQQKIFTCAAVFHLGPALLGFFPHVFPLADALDPLDLLLPPFERRLEVRVVFLDEAPAFEDLLLRRGFRPLQRLGHFLHLVELVVTRLQRLADAADLARELHARFLHRVQHVPQHVRENLELLRFFLGRHGHVVERLHPCRGAGRDVARILEQRDVLLDQPQLHLELAQLGALFFLLDLVLVDAARFFERHFLERRDVPRMQQGRHVAEHPAAAVVRAQLARDPPDGAVRRVDADAVLVLALGDVHGVDEVGLLRDARGNPGGGKERMRRKGERHRAIAVCK